ncbi:G protein-coupled receptor, class C, group 5, member Ba [Megalops cyprinoides]|uniref:G protein-coupled receptor, class C, group 5, member Ba n=1 Tax=Megalops cyprinoides TaxID=118141 RepID=UPI0018646A75|nr:G protein-coupled receptor, class C, group 5, member Ba [Megalops cyprinoides]
MAVFPLLISLLPLVAGVSAAEEEAEEAVPFGCGALGLQRPYTKLCDLEAVWGVVVVAAAGGGVLAALLLGLTLLCRLRSVTEAEKRSGVGPLLLLLLGVAGLFGLSFAYLVERDERLCVVRRALWGVLFALCFSCLLAQGWRLRGLARRGRGPRGCALVGLGLALTLVQGIVAAEWLLLTVLRLGQPACQFQPLDFALACSYVLVLLLAALAASALALCGKERQWRCNGVWLLLSCLASVLLWAAWLGFYLYGNEVLGRSPDWDEPALAVALVAQGWLLLLFHAIPEAHSCLQPPPQPSAPDYFDTSQAPPRMRETSFDEDVPLSHRQFVENQAFAFDEQSAGLRAGGNGNSSTGPRPSAPFRSNVYQPTEMTMILNGGAVPSAPPTYTGRQLW